MRSAFPGSPGRIRCVLSIAGSDSGGGAGIQADVKALARCGVHGMTAVTAITAQSTVGVASVHPVPPEVVVAQIRTVAADIGVDAVKVGMLVDAGTVEAVAGALAELPERTPVVVDPVMVSESGDRLLEAEAEAALVEQILPLATVATPNLHEARVLAGRGGSPSTDASDSRLDSEGEGVRLDAEGEGVRLARAVHRLGPGSVVVTGGHALEVVDVFFDGREVVLISGERHPGGAAHGSGCTHSSVLAALLALEKSPLDAARGARRIAGAAVRDGLRSVGAGAGPVDVIGLAGQVAALCAHSRAPGHLP